MNRNLQLLLLGFGALIAIRVVLGRSEEEKKEDAALGFTEETGLVGTLGAQTNRASGGLLSRFGSFLGGVAADIREAIVGEESMINEITPSDVEGTGGGGGF